MVTESQADLAELNSLCAQLLTGGPEGVGTVVELGRTLQAQGAIDEAQAWFAQAVALRPDLPLLQRAFGVVLRRKNRPSEALAAFRKAQALEPSNAEAYLESGNLLKSLGRYGEAAVDLRVAAALAPASAAVWLNLGVACLEDDRRADAIAAFQAAIKLEPGRAEAHNVLGHARLVSGQHIAAEAAFRTALRLDSKYAAPWDNLGRLLRATGRIEEAADCFRSALTLKPSHHTHSNLLLALNFLPDMSAKEIFREHREWNRRYAKPVERKKPASAMASRADGRLRLGYVSPDFSHHAVAYFIEPVLAHHDRAKFEIFCYSNVKSPDRFTARIQSRVEHWRDISRVSDDDAASMVEADGIDVLVDLAGHTAGNRLLVFARRPAPIQATWIGYPNGTGLDAIDYRFTDGIADPPGQTDGLHAEKLVRLPAGFSCYLPDDEAPPVNELPALKRGSVTFGSFNHLAKINAKVIAVWARILAAVPGSRLLLKARGLADPEVAARVAGEFASRAIDPQRIDLNGEELSVADHLGLYHGVDIGLDTFPYNGTTTTCEALWMGVPVVTLAGSTHVGRVGASLCTTIGLKEWIADTTTEYELKAITAARELSRLSSLRGELRSRLGGSLCDGLHFTRQYEAAVAAMATGSL